MGRSLLHLALSVLLQSVITEANVECFSNVMPNDTGIASNGACQVTYSLTKVNGCDVITGEPRLSAVGRHHQKVLLDPSEVIVLDRCRFDGNSIVCNCETNFCNQNFYSLWPSFLNLYINSSDECRQDSIAAAYTILHPLVDSKNPHTGEPLPGPVKAEPAVDCAVTGSDTTVKGDYCVIEIPLIEGTCYKSTEAPVLSAGIDSEEQVCTSTRKVRVTCNTNNCNVDKEIIRQQISDGFAFTGVSHTPNCRNELLQSVDTLDLFQEPNPCGPGGALESNGTCECKDGWIDIITIKDLPVGHNHTEGEFCVPQNACVLKGEEHVITFIIDASEATHASTNGSFAGIKTFILNADKLIDSSSNRIIFVAYGGEVTKVSTLNHSGWTSNQFKEEVNVLLSEYVGSDTNIADGFDKARELVGKFDRHLKRVVIHIGQGTPTGNRKDVAQSAYQQLAAQVDRVIAVGLASVDHNMEHKWHTPGDYVDFSRVRYEGELCVPQNACVLKGEEHVITFIIDASEATYASTNGSFAGIKTFILNADKLIDSSSNRIIFVAYGGEVTKVSTLNHSGWTSNQFKEEVSALLSEYVGSNTNIADGFDKARELVAKFDRHLKRVVIHIGDGIPTGNRNDVAQSAYQQLAAQVDRVIAVGLARIDDNMEHKWHTPGDYVDFSRVRYENLNLDNMKFLMQKVCPPQPYKELISSSLRLTND